MSNTCNTKDVESNTLRRLKELTTRLPDHPMRADYAEYVRYDVEDGVSYGFPIIKNQHVAAIRVFMSMGSTFPAHSHPVNEYGIIYKGSLELTLKGKTLKKKAGDILYFKANVEHGGKMIEDTEILFITVPADPDYPDA